MFSQNSLKGRQSLKSRGLATGFRCSTTFYKRVEADGWVFRNRPHTICRLEEHVPLLPTGHLGAGYGYSQNYSGYSSHADAEPWSFSWGITSHKTKGCCRPLCSLQHRGQQSLFPSSLQTVRVGASLALDLPWGCVTPGLADSNPPSPY